MKIGTFFKRLFLILLVAGLALLIVGICFLASMEISLPNVEVLKDVHMQAPLRIFTSDKKLIAEFGSIRRNPITLDKVPQQLINATLATEDQRFFKHSGVDFIGLSRATVVLFATGKKAQGGSTITMQVARNFFLTRKKSYLRKIREILLALKIDHSLSKKKILELYFNKIFYGSHAYGIAAAANIYYGKEPNQLTLPQIAMLVGLPKAPSALNPLINPPRAIRRRNHVLKRMLDLHYIDQVAYQAAIAAPITASYHGLKVSVKAPYVAEMARRVMLNQFGKNDSYNHGYDVYTTISSVPQEAARSALWQGLLSYDQRHGYRGPVTNLRQTYSTDMQDWPAELKKIPDVNNLHPGVIIAIKRKSVGVVLKDGMEITIPMRNISWARKEVIKQGIEYFWPNPKRPADFLKLGDVIYVGQFMDDSWALAQVPVVEGAVVALNPQDGAILALVGGFDFGRSNFNRAVQAKRQPGSSFKPFIYSAALEKGFTLSTIINDAPVVMADSGLNAVWRPQNDTRKFYGPTRLRTALIKSRNLVSVRLLQLIGIPYAVNYATRFGFKREDLPSSLSLALGTATISPLEMATGYAVFANGGYKITPYYIDHVLDANDKIIYQAKPQVAGDPDVDQQDGSGIVEVNSDATDTNSAMRVITPQNAYLITSALHDVIQKGTGKEARILKRSDLAGKTGTTNDQSDVWFSGFNSNLVATIWLGFDKPQSLFEYADRAAVPIWSDFMQSALQDQPEATMPQPPGIITVRIDHNTGKLAKASDKRAIFEVFRKQYVPTQKDDANASADSMAAENNEINQIY
jgi:penicillin-binding protein 1A